MALQQQKSSSLQNSIWGHAFLPGEAGETAGFFDAQTRLDPRSPASVRRLPGRLAGRPAQSIAEQGRFDQCPQLLLPENLRAFAVGPGLAVRIAGNFH
jgi:hypothetical protein